MSNPLAISPSRQVTENVVPLDPAPTGRRPPADKVRQVTTRNGHNRERLGTMRRMTEPIHFACETARTRALKVGGLTLNALEWGEPGRPALCFLHGGSAHAHWFDGVVATFAGRYHVLSLDQRGHGASEWAPEPAYATEDFAGDLVGVADAMGWARMTVIGHSMGGHNAMGFAAWYPDRTERLVVVDSRPSIPAERLQTMHRRGDRGPDAPRDARLRAQELPAAAARDRGRSATAGAPGPPGHRRARRRASSTASTRRAMAGAGPPTAGACSSASPRPPCWCAASTRRSCPARWRRTCSTRLPRARLVEIAGTYHHLVLDAPLPFATVLDAFLSEATAPA